MKVYKNESSAYVVRMPHHEQKAFVSDSYLIPIYQELASLNVCRDEGEPMVIPSGSRYEPVLAVMAEYCGLSKGFVPIKRFLALVKLILLPSEKVDFAGKRAYELMQQLYWLTPGGQNPDACLPDMSEDDEPVLRVHKETVEESGAPKTTVVLTIPEGSNILRRMIGAGGSNIKALGTLFVPNAKVHFWLQKVAPPADLNSLLSDEDRSAEAVVA